VRPIAAFPIHVTVAADARVYAIAVLLRQRAAFCPPCSRRDKFGRSTPWQVMKGSATGVFRRLTARDVLLGLQVALCALLVTCRWWGCAA